MLALCKSHPNWIPKKPKLMLNICTKFNFGFTSAPEVVVAADIAISNRFEPLTPKGELNKL
jgi:hypothetical protein